MLRFVRFLQIIRRLIPGVRILEAGIEQFKNSIPNAFDSAARFFPACKSAKPEWQSKLRRQQ